MLGEAGRCGSTICRRKVECEADPLPAAGRGSNKTKTPNRIDFATAGGSSFVSAQREAN